MELCQFKKKIYARIVQITAVIVLMLMTCFNYAVDDAKADTKEWEDLDILIWPADNTCGLAVGEAREVSYTLDVKHGRGFIGSLEDNQCIIVIPKRTSLCVNISETPPLC